MLALRRRSGAGCCRVRLRSRETTFRSSGWNQDSRGPIGEKAWAYFCGDLTMRGAAGSALSALAAAVSDLVRSLGSGPISRLARRGPPGSEVGSAPFVRSLRPFKVSFCGGEPATREYHALRMQRVSIIVWQHNLFACFCPFRIDVLNFYAWFEQTSRHALYMRGFGFSGSPSGSPSDFCNPHLAFASPQSHLRSPSVQAMLLCGHSRITLQNHGWNAGDEFRQRLDTSVYT